MAKRTEETKKTSGEKMYSEVEMRGRVRWSNEKKQKDGKAYIHNYLVEVEKEGKEKTYSHVFNATMFGRKAEDTLYIEGDIVKITGELAVNSYKNDDDEWVNKTYVAIKTITLDI